MARPAHVARETFLARKGCSGVRANDGPDVVCFHGFSLRCRIAAGWIQEKSSITLPLSLCNGRGDPSAGRRGACPTHVLIALWLRRPNTATSRPAVAPYQYDFVRVSATARSQVCRLEFRRRICAQYLLATGCSRATPDDSAHNRHAFQNRDSSGA